MKASKLKFLPLLIGVTILITVGIRWSIGSPDGDYLTLLDRFEVTGPGAWMPGGWSDDFDNGLPDGWTNEGARGPIGTWQDEPGTTFARLESPGRMSRPMGGVHWYRTTIFSYQIWKSYVSAGSGDFQGAATFAAELPQLNQFTWLHLSYVRLINSKEYVEQVKVTISNYSPEIAAILGRPGGLQLEQTCLLWDAETWVVVQSRDFRTKSITPPEILGKVILFIKYIDDPVDPRFIIGYSLTESPEFVVPFPENPITSNLHLTNLADWNITTGIIIPKIPLDIKPGSCPNPLNLKSKGMLQVAILGTEDFDVTLIDPATILLIREGYEEDGVSPLRLDYEDVATPFEGALCDCHDLDGDGYLDLTLKFDTQELVEVLGLGDEAGNTIPLILTGNLKEETGGTPIRGKDCVRIK